MLVRDRLTGRLHQVPDQRRYAARPVLYDRLGEPLGLPFLAPIAAALLPLAAKALPFAATAATTLLPKIIPAFTQRRAAPRFVPAAPRFVPVLPARATTPPPPAAPLMPAPTPVAPVAVPFVPAAVPPPWYMATEPTAWPAGPGCNVECCRRLLYGPQPPPIALSGSPGGRRI